LTVPADRMAGVIDDAKKAFNAAVRPQHFMSVFARRDTHARRGVAVHRPVVSRAATREENLTCMQDVRLHMAVAVDIRSLRKPLLPDNAPQSCRWQPVRYVRELSGYSRWTLERSVHGYVHSQVVQSGPAARDF
jgi:hypothetical protein